MDIGALNQLVNRLHSDNQLIPVSTMQILTQHTNSEISCYAGLLATLYNMQQQAHQTMQLQSFLSFQGDILLNFSKLLTLPQPAIHLAQFDYPALHAAASSNGSFRQIIRHSKGLCPQYDPHELATLHFLPFYHEIAGRENKCSFLLGNRTWKTATAVAQHFYMNKLRKQNRVEWEDSLLGEGNGILLSYVILLRSQQGLSEYTSMLHRLKVSEPTQQQKKIEKIVVYLNYWFSNYINFLQSSLKMYTKSLQSAHNLPLLTQIPLNSHTSSLQFQILHLIRQVSNCKAHLHSPIAKLTQQIHNISCPQPHKNLLLALLHKIECKAGVSRSLAKSYFMQLKNNDQLFVRVFCSDEEIIQKYKEGELELSADYRYGPSLHKTVTEICFVRNPVRYIRQAELCCTEQFIISNLITDDRISQASPNSSYSSQLLQLIESRLPLVPNEHLHNEIVHEYLPIWRQYHDYIINGSTLPSLNHLLSKCQQTYLPATTYPTIHHKLHENEQAVTHIMGQIHDQSAKLLNEIDDEILEQMMDIVGNEYVDRFLIGNRLLDDKENEKCIRAIAGVREFGGGGSLLSCNKDIDVGKRSSGVESQMFIQ